MPGMPRKNSVLVSAGTCFEKPMLLNTACRPTARRLFGAASICRNSPYERVWISIRSGNSITSDNRPKFILSTIRVT